MKKTLITLFSLTLMFAPKYIQSMQTTQEFIGVPIDLPILTVANILLEIKADENSCKAILHNRKEDYIQTKKKLTNTIKRLDQDLGDIEKAKSDNKRLSNIGNLCLWSGIFALVTNRIFPIISPLAKEFWNNHPTFSLITCSFGAIFGGYGVVSTFISNNLEGKIYHYQKTQEDLKKLKKLKSYFKDEKEIHEN